MGVLSNYFTIPKLEFIISPHVFRPAPKVFSAVITLAIKQIDSDLEFRKMLIKTVKTAFNQRRKILSNALGVMLKERGTDDCPIDLNRRAEMLTVEEFTELSRWFMRGESKPFSL
ncbi:MAG: rRNA adenine N-6-methyltransferase family protein [Candidatus Marinimicrobia bacterium]|nr:rRNA adenine N-6-methyltransferase family protein [Candidatus Neomarinimicrobiota bacterium]